MKRKAKRWCVWPWLEDEWCLLAIVPSAPSGINSENWAREIARLVEARHKCPVSVRPEDERPKRSPHA